MTKIKFGTIVTNMSGKIGGQVYSHNASGAYLRNIGTIAVLPSAAILASRARFASVVAKWKTITVSQRNAWNSATINFLKKDVFADTYAQNGFQLFCSINNVMLNIGANFLIFPPFPQMPTNILNLSISQPAGSNSLQLNANGAAVPAGTVWILDATPPISPTLNSYLNLLTQIKVLQAGDIIPSDIYADYVTKYGVPVSGMRGAFRVTPVNLSSATIGQRFFYNINFL